MTAVDACSRTSSVLHMFAERFHLRPDFGYRGLVRKTLRAAADILHAHLIRPRDVAYADDGLKTIAHPLLLTNATETAFYLRYESLVAYVAFHGKANGKASDGCISRDREFYVRCNIQLACTCFNYSCALYSPNGSLEMRAYALSITPNYQQDC